MPIGWFERKARSTLGERPLRVVCTILFALVLLGAGRGPSLKQEMEFGVEAARQGLWREAIFRWEKYLKAHPDNPRLRNNLAVAYESLGRFEEARAAYEEALRLAPDSREIKDNLASFNDLHVLLRQRAVSPGSEAGGEEHRHD